MELLKWYILWWIGHCAIANPVVLENRPGPSVESTPPCYECMLYGKDGAVASSNNEIKTSHCPIQCFCPVESRDDRKPQCSQGVSVVRDGCDCCWICARQSGESCSSRFICDPAEGLECFYDQEGNEAKTRISNNDNNNMQTRNEVPKQTLMHLTAHPPSSEATGICWKRVGRPCLVNGTWLSHSGIQTNPCRHQCSCVDGLLICTDRCVAQEQQRPPEVLCEPLEPNGPLMQLKLMPPALGECCRRWMCVTAVDMQEGDRRPLLDAGGSQVDGARVDYALKGQKLPRERSSSYIFEENEVYCDWGSRQSSPWAPCSQTCGLGLSTRWTTETVDCRNVTQTRLCFWRPCRNFFTQKNKTFTPTLKFAHPGYLKFTAVHSNFANAVQLAGPKINQTALADDANSVRKSSQSNNSTAEPTVCRLERAFQPRFCNRPPPTSCCWPHRSKTKRLRFHCTGGRIVYHFFEWIHTCQCSANPCDVVLGNNTWNHEMDSAEMN